MEVLVEEQEILEPQQEQELQIKVIMVAVAQQIG
tara:strand:- start:365 stop:466 length:102 start_codon:yes stop_codon:yes gene_type:complete